MEKIIITACLIISTTNPNALPVLPDYGAFGDGLFSQEPINATNFTVPKDLYIIRTIVYEVGILTDVGNDTNPTDTNEEVDLTFYNPTRNGTTFDLDDIPVPVQTNVSGVTITGIAPVNFGILDLQNGPPVLNGTLLPNAVVEVKQNVSTTDADKGEELLKQLSPWFGFTRGDAK